VIEFKLKAVLEKHGMSGYRLEQSVEEFAPITIRKIVSGENSVSLESLNSIISALRQLTGKEIEVSDLLEYIPDPPRKSKK
jgi:DNA-binding Xre family transcriptional regulator